MAKKKQVNTEEPLGKKLWKAADKLRKNIDVTEYKLIVLGVIFLKCISNAFKELHQKWLKRRQIQVIKNEWHGKYKYGWLIVIAI